MTNVPLWIEEHYGGKRAFLRYWESRALALMGGYRSLQRIDFTRVSRLVFVCKGNICRSPYAEYVARARGIPAISGGLDAGADRGAHPLAIRVGHRRGFDLSTHQVRRFDDIVTTSTDLVVTFEPEHQRRVQRGCGTDDYQLTLIGLFATPRFGYLHDPYGSSEAYFEKCFVRIDGALEGLLASFRNRYAGAEN